MKTVTINASGLRGNMQGVQSKAKLQRQEREAKRDAQTAALEQSIKNLKTREDMPVEKKLELFHTLQDEISAVKMAYNQEQMMHVMDEARELGEKIAEAREKMEPKTPEERKKELQEEALGTEENEGVLSEVLDETEEIIEEQQEKMQEELQDVQIAAAAEAEEIPAAELVAEQGRKPFDAYI